LLAALSEEGRRSASAACAAITAEFAAGPLHARRTAPRYQLPAILRALKEARRAAPLPLRSGRRRWSCKDCGKPSRPRVRRRGPRASSAPHLTNTPPRHTNSNRRTRSTWHSPAAGSISPSIGFGCQGTSLGSIYWACARSWIWMPVCSVWLVARPSPAERPPNG
jgi:hypothetical protein